MVHDNSRVVKLPLQMTGDDDIADFVSDDRGMEACSVAEERTDWDTLLFRQFAKCWGYVRIEHRVTSLRVKRRRLR